MTDQRSLRPRAVLGQRTKDHSLPTSGTWVLGRYEVKMSINPMRKDLLCCSVRDEAWRLCGGPVKR